MSILLYAVGVIAVLAGAAMVGFGIPVKEFSFGDTLIGAGTTAVVGGLIVIGLGAAVGQLQRIAEALATRPIRSSRPLDLFEPASDGRGAPDSARVPFPSKPKAEARGREPFEPRRPAPAPADHHADDRPPASFAPTLPNPYEPPVALEDEVSLSPQQPMSAPAPAAVDRDEHARPAPPTPPLDRDENESELDEKPVLDTEWWTPPSLQPAGPAQTRAANSTYFDAMWPAESKAKRADIDEAKSEPMLDLPPPEADMPSAMPAEPEAPKPDPGDMPRGVAILKSGVVDGMGYTLYVDGSIEAELPQGTLRFASINELRSHLEKSS
jgi:hypothetical protein